MVEKTWKHEGYRCVVLMVADMGHRNGYVGIPKEHPLHGVGYSSQAECLNRAWNEAKKGPIGKRGIISVVCADIESGNTPELVFNVHGGITYADTVPRNVEDPDGLWWYGYDCAHLGDGHTDEYNERMSKLLKCAYINEGPVRSLEYCIGECESLAKQLAEVAE